LSWAWHVIMDEGQKISADDTSPDLAPMDIKVIVNGQDMEFISLQKFYETFTKDAGMPHYVVQVARQGPASFGKQRLSWNTKKTSRLGERRPGFAVWASISFISISMACRSIFDERNPGSGNTLSKPALDSAGRPYPSCSGLDGF
jgi:hypothetical protein